MRNLIASGVAAAVLGLGGAAWADFPNDNNVTVVIPYSPGGGFDTIVRQYVPELEKALGATVVPENIEGAGGARGGQAVHRAEPDGYTIGIYNIPGLTVNEVTGRDQGFKLEEVSWIANLAVDRYAVAVKADSPVNSMADLCALGRPIKFSDTGATSTASVTTRITMAILGCEIIDVTGYAGSNDAMIAVISGEVDATIKPISSLGKYLGGGGSGDMKMILTLTEDTAVEGIPSATDIGKPELAKFTLNRVIGGPPGIPADVVAKLEDAFRQATESEAITSWANGTATELDFMGAAETAAMMSDLASFYTAYKELVAVKE